MKKVILSGLAVIVIAGVSLGADADLVAARAVYADFANRADAIPLYEAIYADDAKPDDIRAQAGRFLALIQYTLGNSAAAVTKADEVLAAFPDADTRIRYSILTQKARAVNAQGDSDTAADLCRTASALEGVRLQDDRRAMGMFLCGTYEALAGNVAAANAAFLSAGTDFGFTTIEFVTKCYNAIDWKAMGIVAGRAAMEDFIMVVDAVEGHEDFLGLVSSNYGKLPDAQ
jgi:hypothetical protein